MQIIQAEITRLHQLAWRPGAAMHGQWWFFLQLAAWRPYYFADQTANSAWQQGTPPGAPNKGARSRTALQRVLDQLICHKRRYPRTALPAQLSKDQQRLLALEPRLASLVVALGLQLLGSPDYLLRGQYRRVLALTLGWPALDQLWALWSGGDQLATLAPDVLLSQALQCGYRAINSQLVHDPVWQAVTVTLPPPQTTVAPAAVTIEKPLSFLLRLARFL